MTISHSKRQCQFAEFVQYVSELLPFHLSQPLPGILHLSNTRVSIFPEVEEFLVMLYGFGCVALLLADPANLFNYNTDYQDNWFKIQIKVLYFTAYIDSIFL